MKQNHIILGLLAVGALYFLSQNKTSATTPSSPDPIPQVPGTSGEENLLDSTRPSSDKWRTGAAISERRVKIQ